MVEHAPLLDLALWRGLDAVEYQRSMTASLDAALRHGLPFLLENHQIPSELSTTLRSSATGFFRLPLANKAQYRVPTLNGNGWAGLGSVTASLANDTDAAPDLHEYFRIGPATKTNNEQLDHYYPPNQWPVETPLLCSALQRYAERLLNLSDEILQILSHILALPGDFWSNKTNRATWQAGVNWYPRRSELGLVRHGQFRISGHRDFGTVTFLDRPPGLAEIEVLGPDGDWITIGNAPGQFIVLIGDMMHFWTDGRWTAPLHRIKAPDASAPDEELLSNIFFFEANPDVWIQPLAPPSGGGLGLSPVKAGDYLWGKVYEVTPSVHAHDEPE